MKENDNNSSNKRISDSHKNQIKMLRALSANVVTAPAKALQITEIAQAIGINDEREIQRNLFILEGQKLVSPLPAGDFTSRTWSITNEGLRAVKVIENSSVQ